LSESLDEWVERQYRYAATAMLKSISRTDLEKPRPGFARSVRAVKGSIVASPVFGDWDPQPDYFFHWFRDSALIVDALCMLFEAGEMQSETFKHFMDFVRFSLGTNFLDGRVLVASSSWRSFIREDFIQYLRDDADLATAHGEATVSETRINADGSLDISKWSRPQHDGAPLRALTVLRWLHNECFDTGETERLTTLLRFDLAATAKNWSKPAFDMWEEEQGLHYHTLRVSAAALEAGAVWLQSLGDDHWARIYREQVQAIYPRLDGFWSQAREFYLSRLLPGGARSAKELDISVILAVIHAQGAGEAHSARDPKIHTTLRKLEALFDAAYPINHHRAAHTAPAMGRYEGDVYFSGGAYYFSTLGAAELCFAAATACQDPAWIERGNAYLETVRAFTPADGEMSEQFDQRTGAQTSAQHLAWSYAAFISCITARRKALSR